MVQQGAEESCCGVQLWVRVVGEKAVLIEQVVHHTRKHHLGETAAQTQRIQVGNHVIGVIGAESVYYRQLSTAYWYPYQVPNIKAEATIHNDMHST